MRENRRNLQRRAGRDTERVSLKNRCPKAPRPSSTLSRVNVFYGRRGTCFSRAKLTIIFIRASGVVVAGGIHLFSLYFGLPLAFTGKPIIRSTKKGNTARRKFRSAVNSIRT